MLPVRKLLSLPLLLLVPVLCAACAANAGDSPPNLAATSAAHDTVEQDVNSTPDPKDRMQFSGFSILPPPGEHWVEIPIRGEHGRWKIIVMFGKIVPQGDPTAGPHSVYAMAESNDVPAPFDLSTAEARQRFLRFVMETSVEANKVAAGRAHLLSQEAALDQSIGYECFRHDLVAEDVGVKGFEGRAFIMDMHMYTCLDPTHKQLVRLTYSQRTPRGQAAIDLTQEGEGFLKSLSFKAGLVT